MPYEVLLLTEILPSDIPYSYAENIFRADEVDKAQGVTPLPAGWDKAKSDSLTEYLPNHITILKNLTEQVGMNKKQKGDELVLLADPPRHQNINILMIMFDFPQKLSSNLIS